MCPRWWTDRPGGTGSISGSVKHALATNIPRCQACRRRCSSLLAVDREMDSDERDRFGSSFSLSNELLEVCRSHLCLSGVSASGTITLFLRPAGDIAEETLLLPNCSAPKIPTQGQTGPGSGLRKAWTVRVTAGP